MIDIRIHGRGGQGVLPQARWLARMLTPRSGSVECPTTTAGERLGAPVVAVCRVDCASTSPSALVDGGDHAVVLDPTVPLETVRAHLGPGGWVLLRSPLSPAAFRAAFPDNPVATLDAGRIVPRFAASTSSRDLTHCALAAAAASCLGWHLDDILGALDQPDLADAFLDVACAAYDAVQRSTLGDGAHAANLRVETSEATEDGAAASETENTRGPYGRCPAGIDVAALVEAMSDNRIDDALEGLLRRSPLPSVCGRICSAPCMTGADGAEAVVDIRELERWAGDEGRVRLVPAEERLGRVAVVGSGPAGLAAAYHLAILGYGVRILDMADRLGGTLRWAVPDFRLPSAVLDREIDRILELGVEVVLGRVVDGSRLLDLAGAFDAVLVATGLQRSGPSRLLPFGAREDSTIDGITFLRDARRNRSRRLDGEDVLVVGANKIALASARTATRLGAASVRMIAPVGREDSGLSSERLAEAEAEGVVFLPRHPVIEIRPAAVAGEPNRLVCLHESDEPVVLEGHRIILAAQRHPNLSVFPLGTAVHEGDERIGVLSSPIFALGDVLTGAGSVAESVAGGRRAAMRVHRALTPPTEASDAQSLAFPDVRDTRGRPGSAQAPGHDSARAG